jgi:protein dithiol oxidoreductase (disulfide-forming)
MFKRLLSILLFFPVLVFADSFVEGRDFVVISAQNSSVVKNKGPVITEFFSYACPWCYKIEAPLNQWMHQMGSAVTLEKVPVVFKPNWDVYARAYYVANILALTDKMNPALFKALQEEHRALDSNQAMTDFFIAHGVDREIAKSAFTQSPTIDMQISNGTELMAQYQVNGVPAFVVNYKYKTDLQMARGPERLFELLAYLLKKPA